VFDVPQLGAVCSRQPIACLACSTLLQNLAASSIDRSTRSRDHCKKNANIVAFELTEWLRMNQNHRMFRRTTTENLGSMPAIETSRRSWPQTIAFSSCVASVPCQQESYSHFKTSSSSWKINSTLSYVITRMSRNFRGIYV
jgi:hypothetical protein